MGKIDFAALVLLLVYVPLSNTFPSRPEVLSRPARELFEASLGWPEHDYSHTDDEHETTSNETAAAARFRKVTHTPML